MWFGRPFYFADDVAIGVRDLDAAVLWYKSKLGLLRNFARSHECDALLTFSLEDEPGVALVLIPPGESEAKVERHPIIFTKNIEASHKFFVSHGVLTGPIDSDSGGNRFFEFQDLEGNRIEVCTEPQ
jgi:catechol 2,3-dioxygenase-like lactoylglutathione lyase family enzyme